MPLPTPRPEQTEQEFVSMCAASPVMRKEFKNQAQVLGVCYEIYKRHKKKHQMSGSELWKEAEKEIDDSGIIVY